MTRLLNIICWPGKEEPKLTIGVAISIRTDRGRDTVIYSESESACILTLTTWTTTNKLFSLLGERTPSLILIGFVVVHFLEIIDFRLA